MSKYLALRLTIDLESELAEAEHLNFAIFIAPQPPQYILLNPNQTLQQVSEKFWKVNSLNRYSLVRQVNLTIKLLLFFSFQVNKPMEMFYSSKRS